MEKVEKYYGAMQSADKVLRHCTGLRHSTTEYYRCYKVLQRYKKPPQDIVVYLKSPCRKREKKIILRLYKANGSKNPGSVA